MTAAAAHPEKRPMSARERADAIALAKHLDSAVPPARKGSATVAELAVAAAADSEQITVFVVSDEPVPDYRPTDFGDLSPSLAAGLALRTKYQDMRIGGRYAPADQRAALIRAVTAERFRISVREKGSEQ